MRSFELLEGSFGRWRLRMLEDGEECGGGVFQDWQEAYDEGLSWGVEAETVKGRAEAAAPEGGPGEHGAERSLDALREKQAPATPGGEGLNLPPGMPPGEGV